MNAKEQEKQERESRERGYIIKILTNCEGRYHGFFVDNTLVFANWNQERNIL